METNSDSFKNFEQSAWNLANQNETIASDVALARRLHGNAFADAYALILSSHPDEKSLMALRPQLKQFIEIARGEPKLVLRKQFIEKAEDELQLYFEETRAEYQSHVAEAAITPQAQRQLTEAYKAKFLFHLYFQKVLDTEEIPVSLRTFEGLRPLEAFESTYDDLLEFMQKNGATLNSAEIKAIFQTLSTLQDATSIVRDNAVSADDLHQRLDRAPVILPGGTKGHAVLYKVEKMPDGTYQLAVINTGRGPNIREYFSKTKNRQAAKTKDIVYTGLTKAQLTQDFFNQLLESRSSSNHMNEVYEFLDRTLLKNGGKKIEGVERQAQERGTCAVKCITEYMREALGKDLFRRFEVETLERYQTQSETLAKELNESMLKFLFFLPGEADSKESYQNQLDLLLKSGKNVLDIKQKRIQQLIL